MTSGVDSNWFMAQTQVHRQCPEEGSLNFSDQQLYGVCHGGDSETKRSIVPLVGCAHQMLLIVSLFKDHIL